MSGARPPGTTPRTAARIASAAAATTRVDDTEVRAPYAEEVKLFERAKRILAFGGPPVAPFADVVRSAARPALHRAPVASPPPISIWLAAVVRVAVPTANGEVESGLVERDPMELEARARALAERDRRRLLSRAETELHDACVRIATHADGTARFRQADLGREFLVSIAPGGPASRHRRGLAFEAGRQRTLLVVDEGTPPAIAARTSAIAVTRVGLADLVADEALAVSRGNGERLTLPRPTADELDDLERRIAEIEDKAEIEDLERHKAELEDLKRRVQRPALRDDGLERYKDHLEDLKRGGRGVPGVSREALSDEIQAVAEIIGRRDTSSTQARQHDDDLARRYPSRMGRESAGPRYRAAVLDVYARLLRGGMRSIEVARMMAAAPALPWRSAPPFGAGQLAWTGADLERRLSGWAADAERGASKS